MAEPPLPPPPTYTPILTTPSCLDQSPLDPKTLEFNNIAVIIAAMLCAFLCALGLNSTLHCIFRCTQRALTEPVEWAASRRLNSGLKKKDMVALPTSTYAKSSSSPPTSTSVSSSCAICLGDFCEGDKIRVLPKCEHRFHVGCIDEWLLSHSSCPTCRDQLKSNKCVPCLEIVTAS
ncbi:hypothetical protein ACSBR2_014004 [Camellia fascicularis]